MTKLQVGRWAAQMAALLLFCAVGLWGQCDITYNPVSGFFDCASTGTGPAGPTGPTGPTGPAGPPGANGSGLVDCSETSGTLTCPNGFAAGATGAGAVSLSEASSNGTDYVQIKAQDSITTSYVLKPPAVPPAVGQVQIQGTPSGSPSTSVATWGDVLKTGTTNANGYFDWTLGSAPGNPTAGNIRLYPKTGSTLCARDSVGTETCYGAGGGGLGDPGGNGFVDRTALNTTVNRTLTGTANQISITNGGGGGNPVFSLSNGVLGGVQRAAFGSRGTCDGALTNVLVKHAVGESHCNGSAWQEYFGSLEVVAPGPISGWTLVNTPSASGDAGMGFYIAADAAAGENVRSALKAISGSDWTVTGSMLFESFNLDSNFCGFGVAAGTATSNRIMLLGVQGGNIATAANTRMMGHDYTNYTTLSGVTVLNASLPPMPNNLIYWRIAKSGGNWTYSISADNIYYNAIKTEAARFTATHAGFACNARGNNSRAAITAIHYQNQ